MSMKFSIFLMLLFSSTIVIAEECSLEQFKPQAEAKIKAIIKRDLNFEIDTPSLLFDYEMKNQGFAHLSVSF